MNAGHVGFVGVGRMGGPMAQRLLAAGYAVTAFDTSADALKPVTENGGKAVDSAEAVASAAEIVLVSLPTPDILERVVLGQVIRGSKVKIVVDLSTSGPKAANICAKGLAEKGIEWVDSPISGGVRGAREGTLALMVSGKKALMPTIEPILTNFGKIFFCGEKPGLGQVAKLGNNVLAAGVIVMSGEVMAMGVKAGLDPKTLLDIINASTGRNTATTDKIPNQVLTGKFAHGFATGLSYKDVRLCVDESEALGVPMMAGAMVREFLAITNAKYGPDSDFTNIVRLIEDWTGVEIRG